MLFLKLGSTQVVLTLPTTSVVMRVIYNSLSYTTTHEASDTIVRLIPDSKMNRIRFIVVGSLNAHDARFTARAAHTHMWGQLDECIGANHPAIVREIPHFSQNVPHFWLYFEKHVFLQIVIIFGVRIFFVRNGSFTVTDCRLYDETSSSKGRSPAAHIAQTSRASQLPSSLPKQMIARWLLLVANVRKTIARLARRHTRSCR